MKPAHVRDAQNREPNVIKNVPLKLPCWGGAATGIAANCDEESTFLNSRGCK